MFDFFITVLIKETLSPAPLRARARQRAPGGSTGAWLVQGMGVGALLRDLGGVQPVCASAALCRCGYSDCPALIPLSPQGTGSET